MDRKRIIHTLFDISVLAKGADGALEVAGGALLLLTSPDQIRGAVRILTQHELSRDPHDLVAGWLLNSAQHLSPSTTVFAATYLLWHGIVKIGLVTALLMKRRWAYPAAIAAFLLFVVYQLYRYSHTRSPELLVLSVLDVFIIVLTYLEFVRVRSSGGFSRSER